MQNLVLAQEELFQGISCDLWVDNKRNPYMTIQQLANALEYRSKSGIENIIMRNPYLRSKEFSSTHKLRVLEGERIVKRETLVFTKDGIMEIGFLSPKPKAREFRAWARKILTAFMYGQLEWKEKRLQGKAIRVTMTDAIKQAGFSAHFYKHFTDLVYKKALGFNAKQLCEARGAKPKATPLDFLTTKEQAAVNQIEELTTGLILLGRSYDDIKLILNVGVVIYQTTLKMPEKAR
ncbi:BRO family protein [Enterococcus sp. DIV1420a]|uniref:BRO family protein n=1 Tax=Enterococcus sp. DIV1420a TaxID=2774672 RepID=UPI003F1E4C6A